MEDKLAAFLPTAEVAGHDFGSDEINIFIHTNDPDNNFKIIKSILEEDHFNLAQVKIAYRQIENIKYIPLWPKNLVEFQVK